jgi:hypothetical protein
VSLEFTYYKTSGRLIKCYNRAPTGFFNKWVNAGTLENGIEIELM